ncbi:MAG: hypothetical protein JOZ69_22515, partial [Myxococcales bacterium]|nr:hypothetical protein [Myxococcales bacterium]
MSFVRLYVRVFRALGTERRLGVLLAVAGVFLAVAGFAEPVLFGRIVDALYAVDAPHGSGVRAAGLGAAGALFPKVVAWAGFGLFTIVSGTFVALHADRLAHRRRLAVLADYFEHALRLPLGFHGATHSGRVLKVMLDGAQSMWTLWLSLFRTNCTSFVTVFGVLPFALILHFRMGLLLLALVVLFGGLTALVVRRTDSM